MCVCNKSHGENWPSLSLDVLTQHPPPAHACCTTSPTTLLDGSEKSMFVCAWLPLLISSFMSSSFAVQALDRWEERLEGIFEGRPYDILDAALTDTVSKFPVHIQPFRDMIDGMRMDLMKSRYETFDELYEYCYRVAGTVGLMTTPIMGIDPSYKVWSALRAFT